MAAAVSSLCRRSSPRAISAVRSQHPADHRTWPAAPKGCRRNAEEGRGGHTTGFRPAGRIAIGDGRHQRIEDRPARQGSSMAMKSSSAVDRHHALLPCLTALFSTFGRANANPASASFWTLHNRAAAGRYVLRRNRLPIRTMTHGRNGNSQAEKAAAPFAGERSATRAAPPRPGARLALRRYSLVLIDARRRRRRHATYGLRPFHH